MSRGRIVVCSCCRTSSFSGFDSVVMIRSVQRFDRGSLFWVSGVGLAFCLRLNSWSSWCPEVRLESFCFGCARVALVASLGLALSLSLPDSCFLWGLPLDLATDSVRPSFAWFSLSSLVRVSFLGCVLRSSGVYLVALGFGVGGCFLALLLVLVCGSGSQRALDFAEEDVDLPGRVPQAAARAARCWVHASRCCRS